MAFGGATIRPNPTGLLIMFAAFVICVFYLYSGNKLWRSDSQVSLKDLLSVSIDLARSGGNRVRKIHDGAVSRQKNGGEALNAKVKGKTAEGRKELLTDGDLTSHRAIVYGFNKAFPGLHLVSEEHDIKPPDFGAIPQPMKNLQSVSDIIKEDEIVPMSAVTVWIDPLDATQEYSEMKKELNKYVTVMICVAVHGKPILGVVHQPFVEAPEDPQDATSPSGSKTDSALLHGGAGREGKIGRTMWAWVGKGKNFDVPPSATIKSESAAVVGESKAAASDNLPLPSPENSPHVIISRSHAGDVRPLLLEAFGNKTVIDQAGGSGYKVIQVIEKKASLYYHNTLIKKWDVCAGHALIEAVGGKMTTLSGGRIDYKYSLDKESQKVKNKLVVALEKHEEYRQKLYNADAHLKKKASKPPAKPPAD